MESETIGLILLALTTGIFAIARRAQWPRGIQLWTAAAVGLGLGPPAVLLSLAKSWISGGAGACSDLLSGAAVRRSP